MQNHTPTHAITKQHQHASHLSSDKAVSAIHTSQDLTSSHPLHHYINTQLSDAAILTDDPRNITGARILQVSANHTAEEIALLVNGNRNLPIPLTPKLVYHRIHTACHTVAARNNTTFEMVKLALSNARVQTGVKERINASLGRAVSMVMEAAPKKPSDMKKGSDTSLTSISSNTTPSYLGDFFSHPSVLFATNPLFKRLAKSSSGAGSGGNLPWNEDLIRLAARHTVMEIVEMVQSVDPMSNLTNTKVSSRIMDALTLVGLARNLPREVVKREFEAAKQTHGVVKRHYEKISRKRKAGTLKRKREEGRKDSGVVVGSLTLLKRKEVEMEEDEEEEEEEDDDELSPAFTASVPTLIPGLATPSSDFEEGKEDEEDEGDEGYRASVAQGLARRLVRI